MNFSFSSYPYNVNIMGQYYPLTTTATVFLHITNILIFKNLHLNINSLEVGLISCRSP